MIEDTIEGSERSYSVILRSWQHLSVQSRRLGRLRSRGSENVPSRASVEPKHLPERAYLTYLGISIVECTQARPLPTFSKTYGRSSVVFQLAY